jgi:hypothetical protein
MWEPQCPTTLWASTACYSDSFTYLGRGYSVLKFLRQVCYLKMLSVSGLHSIGGKIINKYGIDGGMRIGRRNQCAQRKCVPVPLCPPQIPHDLTLARTQAIIVGSLWLFYPENWGTTFLWNINNDWPDYMRAIFTATKSISVSRRRMFMNLYLQPASTEGA